MHAFFRAEVINLQFASIIANSYNCEKYSYTEIGLDAILDEQLHRRIKIVGG